MSDGLGKQKGVLSNEEFDRLEEVRRLLVTDYVFAKGAILKLEVFSRNRSKRAIYELRDCLDHLSIALQPTTSPAEARHQLTECKVHLRRAAVEPYEWLAERKLLLIEKLLIRWQWIYTLLCLPKPESTPGGADLLPEFYEIVEQIIKGRTTKATSESLGHMEKALSLANELLKKLEPKKFYDRLYNLGLWALGLIIGGLITLIASFLFS